MQLIQTYKNIDWKEGTTLDKGEVVDKETAHEKDLLHLSVHLLIIDDVEEKTF